MKEENFVEIVPIFFLQLYLLAFQSADADTIANEI